MTAARHGDGRGETNVAGGEDGKGCGDAQGCEIRQGRHCAPRSLDGIREREPVGVSPIHVRHR